MQTNKFFNILIVDDEQEYRDVFKMILEENGYLAETAKSGSEALEKLKANNFSLVLTDLIMDEMNGIVLLENIKEKHPDTEVIIFTGYGTIDNAVEAMKKGAFTYFVKSHDPEKLLSEIEKIKKLYLLKNNNEHKKKSDFMLKTKNSKFKNILDIAKKAAKSNVNILLLGESGVGKEVIAKQIHNNSSRNNKQFIPVNCQAFSKGLLESELFGHIKGSFTGAVNDRKGRFEMSHNGTLFLDEIGDISLNTQTKLLRCIESKSVEKIGSNNPIKVDFRLISATNKNLSDEILSGSFREDLFYRISTITIEIPPLRERKEDLPILVDFFFSKSQKEHNKKIINIQNGIMKFLLTYDYPGNIRELKNIIDRLVILADDGIIRKSDLQNTGGYISKNLSEETIKPLKEIRKEFEAEYIEKILEICDNNISETARKLNISRRQLFNKINEYGLK